MISKKAMGALLLELILATIIFFMIQGYTSIAENIPGFSVKPEAVAYIKTVGDTEVCNIDLLNLMRSEMNYYGNNIKFSDAIIRSYLENDYNEINSYIGSNQNNIFKEYAWNFSIESNNEVKYFKDDGAYSGRVVDCVAYLPLPEPLFSECGTFEKKTVPYGTNTIDFFVEGESINIIFQNKAVLNNGQDKFGFTQIFPDVIERYDLSFEQQDMLIDDSTGIDAHSISLIVGDFNRSYDLMMIENCSDTQTTPLCDQSVDIILSKADTIDSCSIKVNLEVSPK